MHLNDIKASEAPLKIPFDQVRVDLEQYDYPMDVGSLFAQNAPVEIEIGSGKGTFILNHAQAFPDKNFLGIEWANKYLLESVDRICRWGVPNVRLMRTDATDFFRCYLVDESITVLHLYFPDPWPKKRHHKKRFFNLENLIQVYRVLTAGGIVQTATDHRDYYDVMCEVVALPEIKARFDLIDFVRSPAAQGDEYVGSNFERKYIIEGREINALALRKKEL
jgi:tRNA (guanine-N7-)-methyltransferase